MTRLAVMKGMMPTAKKLTELSGVPTNCCQRASPGVFLRTSRISPRIVGSGTELPTRYRAMHATVRSTRRRKSFQMLTRRTVPTSPASSRARNGVP